MDDTIKDFTSHFEHLAKEEKVYFDDEKITLDDFRLHMDKYHYDCFRTKFGDYYVWHRKIYGTLEPVTLEILDISKVGIQIEEIAEGKLIAKYADKNEVVDNNMKKQSILTTVIDELDTSEGKIASASIDKVDRDNIIKSDLEDAKKIEDLLMDYVKKTQIGQNLNNIGKKKSENDKTKIDLAHFDDRIKSNNLSTQLVLTGGDVQTIFKNLSKLEKDKKTVDINLFNDIVATCEEGGLHLSKGAKKRMSKEYTFDAIQLLVKIHNEWVNYAGGNVKIPDGSLLAGDTFKQTDIEKNVYNIIESSVYGGFTNITGRMEQVMDGIDNMHACVICMFFTHFNANTLATLGGWARGIEVMFNSKQYGPVAISLYNLCRNVNAETISYLMGGASVISYILTELEDSKFTTGKRAIKWSNDCAIATNTSTFVTNATKNFQGIHANDTAKKVSQKMTKDLQCIDKMTKEQFDKIIKRIDYLKTGLVTKTWRNSLPFM